MAQGVLHSYRKEQREAVNDLVRKVIITYMANYQFGKAGLTLRFDIRQGTVHFMVKDLRTGRRVYEFHTSTRVLFDDGEVMSVEDKIKKF